MSKKKSKSSASSQSRPATRGATAREFASSARNRIDPQKPAQPMMQRDQHDSAARGRNRPKPKGSGPGRSRRAPG